ncbi:hypothetical protein [Paraflavitalea speifideaquila]|uniref:hypothetical protein n=1 Tax=Paraflavitalea speifideaquila TaxID=3076558 RepID=UPI0028EF3302|nr:hypothetical protein [Paraflavitalea speifideiaquila]
MQVLIIEDEKPAAEKLLKALEACDPAIQVLHVLGSIQKAIDWLEEHPAPALIFMDIELSDGLSFRIFEKQRSIAPSFLPLPTMNTGRKPLSTIALIIS